MIFRNFVLADQTAEIINLKFNTKQKKGDSNNPKKENNNLPSPLRRG